MDLGSRGLISLSNPWESFPISSHLSSISPSSCDHQQSAKPSRELSPLISSHSQSHIQKTKEVRGNAGRFFLPDDVSNQTRPMAKKEMTRQLVGHLISAKAPGRRRQSDNPVSRPLL
jgi:hypothetical protein